MLIKNIGALIIGQSPRPDLVSPLIQRLPDGCRVIQAGAMDGLAATSISPITSGTYPLSTRLQDGTAVMVEEAYLAPKLQQALDLLESKGAVSTLLLCAGTFADLHGTRPLFKPFDICCDVLQTLGIKSVGLITPIKEQELPIRLRWQAAGFQPTVWTADLTLQDSLFIQQLQSQIETHRLEGIILDYVGHRASIVNQLQEASSIPVIDTGQLAMRILTSAL
ncbi:MAG: AroM family protein [Anaerolineaceae bacterium]|nr:MAG: AroM family protein [Anaerolineaceae bacterium]